MTIEIKLPELGDGIESGDVLKVLVQEGQVIQQDQGIVELETDKATVEVPCPHAGKVIKIHVRPGDVVPIGGTIITLEATAAAAPSVSPQSPAAAPEVAASKESEPTTSPVSVSPTPTEEPRSKPNVIQATSTPKADAESNVSGANSNVGETGGGGDVAAGPAIRRLAREVGIDLRRVVGTGPSGRIMRDDVTAAVRKAGQGTPAKEKPDDEQRDAFGPVRFERLTKIRKTIAAKMHESWSTVPRVTNFDDADVTELEEFRQGSKADYAAKGIKLTSMPFLIKAVALSLTKHPLLNASLDLANEQVILKEYVNIGVAVDTDRGLVVPTLRSADAKSISDIAADLKTLADAARTSSFSIQDLQGGTFTISNLGAIGGAYSTPIINTPEVAILLVGRSRKLPVVDENDQVRVRLMMPLSLSYDHRLVDGGAAARFLNDVIGFLQAPSRLLLAS
ncbi:MAG: 2-oxo acid dehydrogenase subunit E2 [Planctomycetales bacterium]